MDIELVKSLVRVDTLFISLFFSLLTLYYYGISLHCLLQIKFHETLAIDPGDLIKIKSKGKIYISIALALSGFITVVLLGYPRLIIYLIENYKI